MRVVVADAQADVRYALRVLLQLARELDAEVVGESAEADTLARQVMTLRPDLLLLDWNTPGLDSANPLTQLRALDPQLKIIILSVRPESQPLALKAGADAFVCKGDPVDRLVAAIQDVRSTLFP